MKKLIDLYDVTCYLYDDHGSCNAGTNTADTRYIVDATLSRKLNVKVRGVDGWITASFVGRPDFVHVAQFIQDTLNTNNPDKNEQGANSGNIEHRDQSGDSDKNDQGGHGGKPGHSGKSGQLCHRDQSHQWSIGEDVVDVVICVEWLIGSYSIRLVSLDDARCILVHDNCVDESFRVLDEWYVAKEDAVKPGSLADMWEMAEREVDVEVEFASAANKWLQTHLTVKEMNAILEKKHQSAAHKERQKQ